MSNSPAPIKAPPVSAPFNEAVHQKPERKKVSPFSIRFSDKERAWLEHEAGNLTLGAYIRQQLFPDNILSWSPRRPKKRRHEPTVDQTSIGQLLSALGQSRLSSNLNQIAKAANIGALPVTPDLEEDLAQACADISEIRRTLLTALGIKPGSPS